MPPSRKAKKDVVPNYIINWSYSMLVVLLKELADLVVTSRGGDIGFKEVQYRKVAEAVMKDTR